jgi:hypothetical protein
MQAWITQHPAVLWLIIPGYPIALFLGVAAIISCIGGWSALAKQFRLQSPFNGVRWTMQSGHMRGIAGYNHCLTVGCNPEGLYMAMTPMFRFRHPPLLVPWHEINVSRRKIIFWDYVRFGLGRELNIPFFVRPKLAQNLRLVAGDHWPTELVT